MGIKKIEQILQLQTYGMYYDACHQWAKFFEHMGISWDYWPDDDREEFFCTEADFYLPDQDAYFVVDLGRPDRGYVNCKKLTLQTGKMIILGGQQGTFRIFENGEDFSRGESWLCRCAVCQKWFFLNSHKDYTCKVCGAYDGDHHLMQTLGGDEPVFSKMRVPDGCDWLFKKGYDSYRE